MIKYLKVRPEPVKLEENARGKVHDIGFGNDFFGHDTKNTGNKSRNRQMELQMSKKFLHSKGYNQQSEKATCGMEENICKPYIKLRVNFQNT